MNDLTPYPRQQGQLGPPGAPIPSPDPHAHGPQEADLVQADNLRKFQRLASFFGLMDVLEGEHKIARWVLPPVVAIILSVVLAGGWHALLGTAARPAHRRPQLVLIIAMALGLTVLQFGTTGWFMATGVGGGTAVQYHHTAFLNEVKTVLGKLIARVKQERGVLTHLTRAEAELRAFHGCELEDGCISGVPGPGKVARDLEGEVEIFRRSTEELQRALDRRPVMLAHVRDVIERAQLASRAGDEEGFAAAVNAALSGLSGADAASPADLLQALGSDSPYPAVQALYARLRRSMQGVGEFEQAVRLPVYEPTTRAAAVIEYANRVPFAWGTALALDCLPLSLLLLLLLASYRAPEQPPQVIPYDYDYDELERLRRVLDEESDQEIEEVQDDPPPGKRPRGRPRKTSNRS